MATRIQSLLGSALHDVRVHSIDKWVRARLGEAIVVSTTAATVVWEPRRVVPSYAVPVSDVHGELVPHIGDAGQENIVRMGLDGPPVLDPTTPFSVHTCAGTPLSIRTVHGELPGAAFAPEDPDLAGYVILDWAAFTSWQEEDDVVVGHPHDPFDRIDCLRSSRHIVVASAGQVLADTRRSTLLFETALPMRYYVPRDDVRMDVLAPSELRSVCAYKGTASYWSATIDGRVERDIAWSYEQPVHDALPVRGMICFFSERVDLTVDEVTVPRPVTPWS
jgi:uncharacterized protein (DUF427 family)